MFSNIMLKFEYITTLSVFVDVHTVTDHVDYSLFYVLQCVEIGHVDLVLRVGGASHLREFQGIEPTSNADNNNVGSRFKLQTQ